MALRPGQRKNRSNNQTNDNNNSYDDNSFDNDGFYETNYADDTQNYQENGQYHAADVNYYDGNNQYENNNYDNNTHYNENDSWNSNSYEQEEKPKKQNRFQRIRPKHIKKSTSSSFKPRTVQPNTSFRPQIPQQQQQPNTNNNNGNSFFPANNLQSLAQKGFAAAATSGVLTDGFSAKTAANLMNQLPLSNIAPGILSFRYYKYYFRVHNEYVVKKMVRLLFPFLKMSVKEWKRKKIDDLTDANDNIAPPPQHFAHYSYQPPIYDINAPDGYIPLMAIITYIVIMGFVVGTQSEDNDGMTFSPQVLIATGSSAFVMLLIEVLLMKIGFYLIGSVATPPYWIDIICYTGYKLIFVTVNLMLNLVWANLIFYYIVSVMTGIFAAIFMIQTLRPYFRDLSEFASGPLMNGSNEPKKTRKIFLGIVGIAQIIFIQLMGRYTSL